MSEQREELKRGAEVFESADPRDNKENFLKPPSIPRKDSKKAKPKDVAKETKFPLHYQTVFLWGLKTDLQRAMWLHILKHPNDSPEQMHRDTGIAANSFRNFLRREDVKAEIGKVGGELLKIENPLFVAAITKMAESAAKGSFKHSKFYIDSVLRQSENTKAGDGNITVKLLGAEPCTGDTAIDKEGVEAAPELDDINSESQEEDSLEDY